MHNRRTVKKFISIVIVSLILTSGCGDSVKTDTPMQSEKAKEEASKRTSMLTEAEYDYEVPKMSPLILVDKLGYATNDSKQAIIEAPILPAVFYVIDSQTEEEVFKGNVKKTKSTEDGDSLTGICDFTELKTEGEFYIKAEIVGVSQNYKIYDNYYEQSLINAYSSIEDFVCNHSDSSVIIENSTDTYIDASGGYHTDRDGRKDVVEGCLSVLDLLSSYEFNKKAFSDDCGISMSGNKIPDVIDISEMEVEWLLKMQNSQTGGVYSSLQRNEAGELVVVGETTNATALFCAAMAKSAMVLKNYYPDVAKRCNQAAGKAWKCLEANKALVPSEQMFRAAVEMYRLTGYGVYNNVIKDFLASCDNQAGDSRIVLDGAISYLATPRNTDTKACGTLMTGFMTRTEDKATSASKSRYNVESGEMTPEELLRNAYELTIVDYAISSTEYTKLEKNYLHYLGGRNSDSIIYLNNLSGLDSYAELIGLVTMLNYKK